MKKGGGRIKGACFEREIAANIQAAFAEFGIGKEDVYRSPLSGGHRFAKKTDPGDLVLSPRLAKLFPCNVEAKHEREIHWDGFFRKWNEMPKTVQLKRWAVQCVAATGGPDIVPLVVFRANFTETFCFFPEAVREEITAKLDSGFASVPFLKVVTEFAVPSLKVWRIYPFRVFLGACVSIARRAHGSH